jgi:hypothetical protein
MPSRLELVKVAAASIPVAAPGQLNAFVDLADGLVKTKDEFGVVRNQSGTSATEIANSSANPAVTDLGPEPTAVGMVLATTVIGPPHRADFVDPRIARVSASLRIKKAIQTIPGPTIALDELLLCDPGLGGGSNNQLVTLPAPALADEGRMLGIKIVSTADGFTVTVAGAVSGQVDGLLNGSPDLDLTTDRQWMILLATGTGYVIIG